MKKDCSKFKIWLDKKGTQFSFVCYESNMVNVNHNTWCIDSGSTIHVSNTLQGMQNLRKPVGSEQCIYSGSKMSSRVEAISTYSLVLSSGFILELEKTFYVPSFSRNLISISRLVPLAFHILVLVYLINLKLLVMVHCLVVFSIFSYKMILLIILCMLLLD